MPRCAAAGRAVAADPRRGEEVVVAERLGRREVGAVVRVRGGAPGRRVGLRVEVPARLVVAHRGHQQRLRPVRPREPGEQGERRVPPPVAVADVVGVGDVAADPHEVRGVVRGPQPPHHVVPDGASVQVPAADESHWGRRRAPGQRPRPEGARALDDVPREHHAHAESVPGVALEPEHRHLRHDAVVLSDRVVDDDAAARGGWRRRRGDARRHVPRDGDAGRRRAVVCGHGRPVGERPPLEHGADGHVARSRRAVVANDRDVAAVRSDDGVQVAGLTGRAAAWVRRGKFARQPRVEFVRSAAVAPVGEGHERDDDDEQHASVHTGDVRHATPDCLADHREPVPCRNVQFVVAVAVVGVGGGRRRTDARELLQIARVAAVGVRGGRARMHVAIALRLRRRGGRVAEQHGVLL
mmetsp:Transcript_31233/g.96512  ORF Transcript_31233/g.96512 Transcript_31233/m.96512 type:complete len:411 (-) Transcript_31233:329-1561(-)